MPRTDSELRLNSFFAGIGGFELAFERQGFEVSFRCENDDFCRSVLRRHWPGVAEAGDIRDVRPEEIPEAQVWTAGFPCQDVSVAKAPHGRPGFRGNKSSLFFAFHELIAARRPEIVVLENVTGLLNSHGGQDFQLVLEGLVDLGYAAAWRVLNARYFGVPQSRARVFIVAWNDDPERAARSLYESKAATSPKGERRGFVRPSQCDVTGAVVPQVSYCISATSARHTGLDWARTYISYDARVRRPTPLETERLQGLPDGWTIPSDDYGTHAEELDTERYRATGNAVAIPVVAWIASRIATLYQEPDAFASQQVEAFPALANGRGHLGRLASDFQSREATFHSLRRQDEERIKWERGGCAVGEHVVHAPVSTAPVHPVESRLVDFIEKREVADKYFLSPNAAEGILRRVERRGRNLFPPLDTALRALLSADEAAEFTAPGS